MNDMKFFSNAYAKKPLVLLSVTIFLILVIVAFGVKVKDTEALLGFGGPIIAVYPCTCFPPGGVAISVGLPGGGPGIGAGTFLYETGVTLLHKYGQWFRPGPWVLGTYIPTPGAVCAVLAPIPADPCIPLVYITGGTIVNMGTSL